MDKYNFSPDRILNLDETGVTTVLPSPKVIAETGKKQVGQIVARERGELVTVCAIITANCNSLAPVFIFPRLRYKSHYLAGAPTGSLGFPSSTGWMTAEHFLKVLQHIKEQTNCTRERPYLLLLDNHSSHVTLEAVCFAKDRGIVLSTFPPHCSHRLQPLDIGVFGPFKAALRVAFNDLTRTLSSTNTGIRVEHIASLVGKAYLNSFTPKNIVSSFSKPGIWPVNRLAFSDEDFLCSYVTDRPPPSNNTANDIPMIAQTHQTQKENLMIAQTPQTSNETPMHAPTPSSSSSIFEITPSKTSSSITNSPSSRKDVHITPENVLPFPKAGPRKNSLNGRERGKSRVFTETPEKKRLEDIEEKKKRKLVEKEEKLKKKVERQATKCLKFSSKKMQA